MRVALSGACSALLRPTMPGFLDSLPFDRYPILAIAAIAAAAAITAWGAAALMLRAAARVAAGRAAWVACVGAVREPLRMLAASFAMTVVFHAAPDDLRFVSTLRHLGLLLVIAGATWSAIRAVGATATVLALLHPTQQADNLSARRVQTQARVISRTLSALIGIVGFGLALVSFPNVREIGASLLASAGVAGLIAGFAARPVLGNVIAGLQIALTQPLRLDDVLIVEGEWGRVEEIGSTYVVLRIWDERRLIIPLQTLIEKPFQNWTRQSAQILGTVLLWVDPAMPIDPLRTEARRTCEDAGEWDRRVCGVQVTDTSETAIQVRVLVSSADAGSNFALRCKVREALVAFLQREHPEGLPRRRLERAQRGAATTSAPAGGTNRN